MSSADSGFGGVLSRSTERFPTVSVATPALHKKRKQRKAAKPRKTVAKKVIRKKRTVRRKKTVQRNPLKLKKRRIAVKAKAVRRHQPKLFI